MQKGAWAELDVVEKRIRQQETDVERMKDEYHREVLHLRNLVKQKENIISRLQQEKTYVKHFIQLFMLPEFLSFLKEGSITRLKHCTCHKLFQNLLHRKYHYLQKL